MSDVALPLSPGVTVGGYQIEKVLGQGGFGITYLASHETKSGKFAVKEYFPSGAAQRNGATTVAPLSAKKRFFDVGLKDFFDEAMLMTTLPAHAGLVRVVAALKKFGTAYCVMEFIDGDTMDRLYPSVVRQYGHFPNDLVMSTLENILSALDLVHAEGLIHRDIKPSNIMIARSDGAACLIDFGAARNLAAPRKTHSSFTETYAPIEQFPNAKLDEGPYTDFYALGVTLYILLTQAPPPSARDRKAALDVGQGDPYVPLVGQKDLEKRYNGRLLKAIDACLAVQPVDRPLDTAVLYQMLGLKRSARGAPRAVVASAANVISNAPAPQEALASVMSLPSKLSVAAKGVREMPMDSPKRKPDIVLFTLFLVALAALLTLIAYYVLDYKGVLS